MSLICFWKASYEYDTLCMTQINDNSVSMYCVYCKVLLYTCWSYLFHRLVVRGKSPLMLLPLFCKESRSRGFGQQALDQSHTHFLTHYFALFYPIHKEVLLSGEEIVFELKQYTCATFSRKTKRGRCLFQWTSNKEKLTERNISLPFPLLYGEVACLSNYLKCTLKTSDIFCINWHFSILYISGVFFVSYCKGFCL